MTCAVKKCMSIRRLMDEGNISFHTFPKKGPVSRLWLEKLNINPEGWQWKRHKYVCSKHFKAEDFISDKKNRILKLNAVPSLFLDNETQNLSVASTSAGTSDISQNSTLMSSKASLSQISLTTSAISGSSSDSISKENTLKRIARKRKLNKELQSSSTSTSTSSSGTKRKRVEFIKKIHSYSSSPSTVVKKNIALKKSQLIYRKQLYTTRKQVSKLKNKVFQMQNVVDFLKKQEVSNHGVDHINKSICDVPHLLMSRYLKNIKNKTVTHETYPEHLRRFAATLQFYSSKAYEAVRKEFALALPEQATIRKWYANIECDPGFLDLSFNLLEQKAEEAQQSGRDLIVALIFDEMSVKKQIQFDGKKMWGYVDVGVPVDNDQLEVAGDALVIQVVCHQASWKLPIGYFLIKSLNSTEKANLVHEAIMRLHEKKINISSVTCDGPNAHFAMFENLGCDLNVSEAGKNLNTSFIVGDSKIFSILDACHMVKLARNNLASLKSFKDPSGRIIEWEYIRKLHELQEKETLNLANKLSRRHLEFSNQKMKVSLAAQTLSQSVADALRYLRVDAKHPDFKDSLPTEEFILRINRLFDILNSRNPFARGDNAALRESNEPIWRPFLEEMVEYLLRCTDITGRPLYLTPHKTPFKGFAVTIKSVIAIFDHFVKNTKQLKYILTFKMSQDHLETFFCAIRCRNGWNNNPTPLQFKYSLRRLLLHSRVDGQGGNCRVLDSTVVLSVSSQKGKVLEPIDYSLVRRYGLDLDDMILQDEEYNLVSFFIPLSEIASDVVAYIAGYVIKMLINRRLCIDCIDEGAFGDDIRHYNLINRKDRGGLKRPSQGLIKICIGVEKIIRKLMILTGDKLPAENNFQLSFVVMISQMFYEKAEILFPRLLDHFQNNSPLEENHSYILIKHIVSCYVRIRFFNLAKKFSTSAQGTSLRQKLNKLVLFNHQ